MSGLVKPLRRTQNRLQGGKFRRVVTGQEFKQAGAVNPDFENLCAAALAKSVGRAPDHSTMPGSLDQLNAGSQPASAIGAGLDLLCRTTEKQAPQ